MWKLTIAKIPAMTSCKNLLFWAWSNSGKIGWLTKIIYCICSKNMQFNLTHEYNFTLFCSTSNNAVGTPSLSDELTTAKLSAISRWASDSDRTPTYITPCSLNSATILHSIITCNAWSYNLEWFFHCCMGKWICIRDIKISIPSQ